ncbi:prolyl endopeptidase FAP-like [Polistes fuscatus]|uniref:prolyl endopeptidase FAP-like n=1 Tax=Polistes fuscatus TaxID=30207 RepID=UPI001CA7F416|nr:prolyl endopeptidase FAP-like [Polistes fuscatus]
MAVRHYAREYAIRIKEKNQDSADDSDNGELEDHYPLIRQTEKDLKIINSDIYKGINNGFRSSSKINLMTKNKRTNWRRLLAGGLVAIVALALVVAAVILLTGSPDSSTSRTTSAPGISLEEWLAGSLSPKSFNATWLSGNEILYRDEIGNLVIYNVESASSKIILDMTNSVSILKFK